MRTQALHVVDVMGRERFIWATSAAEARAQAADHRGRDPRTAVAESTQSTPSTPSGIPQQHVRYDKVSGAKRH
jgi:hypothetical protein